MRLVLRLLALSTVVCTGCRFGEAHFTSTVEGRAFDPAGTVFAYVDQHDDDLIVDSNPRVAILMTWIIFDPNGDLNDLEGSAIADYGHELRLRDALSLSFDAQGDMRPDAVFESTVIGDEEDGNVTTHLHLAPERLDAASTYGDVVPLASERTTLVQLTAATFDEAAPVIAGNLTVTFTRTAQDPGNAREGVFEGAFQAPLAQERASEQNLALLGVGDVLGLPLGPRSDP